MTGARLDALAGITLSLVGPGRVGESLASWAVACGADLEAVAGHGSARAAGVAERLHGRAVSLEAMTTAGSDVLLLAVPDGAIAELAATLATRPQAPVVLHTAGSLGASVLRPLAEAGSATGCFHPLKAFPRPLPDLPEAEGTFFGLDGAPPAVALGERLASAFGGVPGVVPEAARDLYHLAASVAAGGVATLVSSAGDLARTLGLPDAVLRGYLELAHGALRGVESELAGGGRPEQAITGPLARGDTATFLRELEALAAAGPPASIRVPLFARLALETVRLTTGPAAATDLANALRHRGFLDHPGDRC